MHMRVCLCRRLHPPIACSWWGGWRRPKASGRGRTTTTPCVCLPVLQVQPWQGYVRSPTCETTQTSILSTPHFVGARALRLCAVHTQVVTSNLNTILIAVSNSYLSNFYEPEFKLESIYKAVTPKMIYWNLFLKWAIWCPWFCIIYIY